MIYSSIILACILVAGSQASYKHKKGEYLQWCSCRKPDTKIKEQISVDCRLYISGGERTYVTNVLIFGGKT